MSSSPIHSLKQTDVLPPAPVATNASRVWSHIKSPKGEGSFGVALATAGTALILTGVGVVAGVALTVIGLLALFHTAYRTADPSGLAKKEIKPIVADLPKLPAIDLEALNRGIVLEGAIDAPLSDLEEEEPLSRGADLLPTAALKDEEDADGEFWCGVSDEAVKGVAWREPIADVAEEVEATDVVSEAASTPPLDSDYCDLLERLESMIGSNFYFISEEEGPEYSELPKMEQRVIALWECAREGEFEELETRLATFRKFYPENTYAVLEEAIKVAEDHKMISFLNQEMKKEVPGFFYSTESNREYIDLLKRLKTWEGDDMYLDNRRPAETFNRLPFMEQHTISLWEAARYGDFEKVDKSLTTLREKWPKNTYVVLEEAIKVAKDHKMISFLNEEMKKEVPGPFIKSSEPRPLSLCQRVAFMAVATMLSFSAYGAYQLYGRRGM